MKQGVAAFLETTRSLIPGKALISDVINQDLYSPYPNTTGGWPQRSITASNSRSNSMIHVDKITANKNQAGRQGRRVQ